MGDTGCDKQCPLCRVRQALASREEQVALPPRCDAVAGVARADSKLTTPPTNARMNNATPALATQSTLLSEGVE